jgi:RimJ/RimL family protein N-acetyltransferase
MTGIENPILLDIPDQLETARLTLRVPRAGDGPVINAGVQDSLEALQRWMPWAQDGQTVEQSEIFARESAVQFIQREALNYMIWTKSDPQFVGMVGLFDLVWEVPSCEVGYWLRTSMEGQGYMTEAVNGVTAFAFATLHLQRVQIRCGGDNRRSAAVANRAGYTFEGRMRQYYRDWHTGTMGDLLVYAKIPGE